MLVVTACKAGFMDSQSVCSPFKAPHATRKTALAPLLDNLCAGTKAKVEQECNFSDADSLISVVHC